MDDDDVDVDEDVDVDDDVRAIDGFTVCDCMIG